MSRATVTVEGFVAADLVVQQTQGGKNVVNVSIPQQRSKRNDQGGWDNVGETTWYQASFWEAEADLIASLVHKGTPVIVTGQPEVKVYAKQDGTFSASVILNFPTLGIVPKVPRDGRASQPRTAVGNPQEEPWGQPAVAGGQQATGDVWAANAAAGNDETPF